MKLKTIPRKLKRDAIIEALFEMRFSTDTIPEILFGRMADFSGWKGFQQRRLPAYDLPAPIRQADENLRYQPTFELEDQKNNSSLRMGPQVLSFHQREPYGSWAQFRPHVEETIDQLFAKADNVKIRRLGLRYLNALEKEKHNIKGVADIDVDLIVSSDEILENVNVNFVEDLEEGIKCQIRIATTDFVQGTYPRDTTVIVDVDVFTQAGFGASKNTQVKDWLKKAHQREKECFFALLKQETIDALRED